MSGGGGSTFCMGGHPVPPKPEAVKAGMSQL